MQTINFNVKLILSMMIVLGLIASLITALTVKNKIIVIWIILSIPLILNYIISIEAIRKKKIYSGISLLIGTIAANIIFLNAIL